MLTERADAHAAAPGLALVLWVWVSEVWVLRSGV